MSVVVLYSGFFTARRYANAVVW